MSQDWSQLEAVAEKTGGVHFVAETSAELKRVYDKIDQLERVAIEDPRYATTDLFGWPLGGALVCFGLAILLEVFWLGRLPA